MESPQRSHVGHDELDNVVEGPNGTLIDTRTNSTYCGSCYGAEDPEKGVLCCNTCAEVRERYRARGWALASAGDVAQCKRETFAEQVALQTGEGCQVYGHFEVNKVAGNFHLAPGKSYQQGAVHVHDLQLFGPDAYFNFSHVVNKLSYGAEFPGLINPLDGAAQTQQGPHLMYQYFIKVVPTVYRDMKGSALRTAQFSVTEYHKCVPPPAVPSLLPAAADAPRAAGPWTSCRGARCPGSSSSTTSTRSRCVCTPLPLPPAFVHRGSLRVALAHCRYGSPRRAPRSCTS